MNKLLLLTFTGIKILLIVLPGSGIAQDKTYSVVAGSDLKVFGSDVYSTFNPKADYTEYSNLSVDMIKMDAKKITPLHRFSEKAGIQAVLLSQPGKPGSVELKVFSYAGDREDGKGELIYGCRNTRGGDDLIEEAWYVPGWEYFRYVQKGFKPIEPEGKRQSTDSYNAVQYYSLLYDDVCKKLKADCKDFRPLYLQLPVIIELKVTNAIVKKVNIPGIGELTGSQLINQKIKGGRIKIEGLTTSLEFADQKVIAINDKAKASHYKFALLRKSQLEGITQSIVPANGFISMVAESADVVKNALISPCNNNSLFQEESTIAFTAAKGDVKTNYRLYYLKCTPGQKILLKTGNKGPFIMDRNLIIQSPDENEVNRPILRKPEKGTLVCAHRGYWEDANVPENNPLAFERALSMKADIIELDVKLTKDKVLVLFHDDVLYRLTNYDGPAWRKVEIKDLNYESCNNIGGGCNPLKSALLKDRFGNVLPGTRMLTLEEAFQWFKKRIDEGQKVMVALDKITGQSHMAFDIALKTGMEDYLIFKGPDRPGAYTPAELEKRFGSLMQQIMYTPYVFEERGQLREAFAEWDRREAENFWVVPGYEMQIKTDSTHAPAFKKEGNRILKSIIESHRATKWIGITHLFPTSIDGVDLKKVFDDCEIPTPENDPTCSNWDWRTDLDFDVNYVNADYFITDRPDVTIQYLKNLND